MMTKAFLTSLLLTASVQALAIGSPEIVAARMDGAGKNILVDVRYGGGCKKHEFELKVTRGCAESMPVQCSAQLVDKVNDDFCEALLSETVVLSLAKYGLTEEYYDGARFTITGSRGSSATVTLPSKRSPTPSARASKVACVTNTGSSLQIDPSSATISLETASGQSAEFAIVSTNSLSLESNPPTERTTYKMDDGRSVVTEFLGDKKIGSGYYIRLDGNASPAFQSCQKVR